MQAYDGKRLIQTAEFRPQALMRDRVLESAALVTPIGRPSIAGPLTFWSEPHDRTFHRA